MSQISVVVPSYNQAQYLPECIESVLGQGLQPYEIIVVDDGSTDNSLEIARKYPVKVISQTNRGLSAARNTGLMNATGEYILPLDADDKLCEGAISRIQEVIDETNVDIVSPSFMEFGIRNQMVILMPNPTLEDFKTGNRVGYCSAIRRACLLEVGGYSPRMMENIPGKGGIYQGYEDFALWFDLLSRGKQIVTIPEVLWMYRTKEHSMINDAQAHHEELMGQIVKDFPQVFPKVVEIKTPLPQ